MRAEFIISCTSGFLFENPYEFLDNFLVENSSKTGFAEDLIKRLINFVQA
jgi:transposase